MQVDFAVLADYALIDQHGNVVERFATRDTPEKIEKRILEVLYAPRARPSR